MKSCIWRATEFGIFIILLLAPSCLSQGRRYDIEEEALKLFHEDLRSVVARFRRSPEYLKILRDKVDDMFKELEIKETYLFLAQKEVIEKRVKEVLSLDNSTASVDCVTEETVAMAGEDATQGRFFRRTHETTTQPGLGVSLLDGYSKFSDRIQVTERNKLRDIGFEEAGNLIHQIKKAMETDEPEATTAGDKPAQLTAPGKDAEGEGGDAGDAASPQDEESTHVSVHTVTTEEATTLLPPLPPEGEVTPEGEAPPPEEAPSPETEALPQKLRNKITTKPSKTKTKFSSTAKITKTTKANQGKTTRGKATSKATQGKTSNQGKVTQGKGNLGKTTQNKSTQGKTTQGKKKGRREFTTEKSLNLEYLPYEYLM